MKKTIRAICVKCGNIKTHRFAKCNNCGLNPKKNNLDMAKSIVLSTRFDPINEVWKPSSEELEHIGKMIKEGGSFDYNEDELRMLLNEKEVLDQATWKDYIKLYLIIIIMISFSAICIALFIKTFF